MEIAIGVLGPFLPKLSELLVGQFNLEKRVRKDVESLVTELTLMHAALCKVAKVPPEQVDNSIKTWARNVKELSYMMEDIVDTFMVRVDDGGEPANPKNRVKKLLKKTMKLFKKGKELHHISDALEEAAGQAKQLAKLRQRYEQEMRGTSSGSSIDPRVMALYTDVTELVGIEDSQDELINMLTDGDDWSKYPLKTVSIVGFGGLGKTTLAKAVYDKIKVQFDSDAFVSVSQNPDMKKVFKDILYELDNDKYAGIHNATRDERQLIDILSNFLKDKRYLIIIDDIWNKEAWQLIKCAFSKNSLGSRLIMTTRIVGVAIACCSSSDDIYRMQPLSNNASRNLFFKRVFSHEKGCPQEFWQVFENILKKCGGVPLAIIHIASLLANNHRIETKDRWYGLLNSIGHGLTEDHNVDDMRKILLLSYYDLPSYLKPCLLYLNIFPEDHKIMRDKLIWRWISEGFVYSQKQESSLYEVGDSYFNELVNRSMIQPVGIDDEEKVEACCVHDMILDLICSISNEENFVTIFDIMERENSNLQSKVRRLSIRKNKVDVPTTSLPHVRSLTFSAYAIIDQVPLISTCRVLRVLDLEGCTISDIGFVENLLHLRYLGLKGTNVMVLPREIGKLRFLQTLDVRHTSITELPSSIVWLKYLMCLHISYDIKLPPGMGNLTSLEVLDGLLVGRLSPHIVKELSYLTKLRVLRCRFASLNDSEERAWVESLNVMHKLECLDIDLHRGCIDLRQGGWAPAPHLRKFYLEGYECSFMTVPAWINQSSLPRLSNLRIFVREVRPEDIRVLGILPALRHLWLEVYRDSSQENVVEMSIVTPDAFPCASECNFIGVAAVPSTFPLGAAPRLKAICFSLPALWIVRGDIDLGMRHLPSLERVTVDLLWKGCSGRQMMEAETTLSALLDDHPNHPSFRVIFA